MPSRAPQQLLWARRRCGTPVPSRAAAELASRASPCSAARSRNFTFCAASPTVSTARARPARARSPAPPRPAASISASAGLHLAVAEPPGERGLRFRSPDSAARSSHCCARRHPSRRARPTRRAARAAPAREPSRLGARVIQSRPSATSAEGAPGTSSRSASARCVGVAKRARKDDIASSPQPATVCATSSQIATRAAASASCASCRAPHGGPC
jgi:hypothetical protein